MRTINRRRRLGAIAGGLSAAAAGLTVLLGHHSTDVAASNRFFLIGLSIGITVGVAVLLIVKMRAAQND